MDPNRRTFIKHATTGALALIAPAALAESYTDLPEDDPIALALGYKIDATSVDIAKYPKRSGPEGTKQFCNNCALYADKGNDKGTCTAIKGRLVAGAGWCNAWVPKP